MRTARSRSSGGYGDRLVMPKTPSLSQLMKPPDTPGGFDLRGHVVVGLGAQEEPGTRLADAPAQHQLIAEAGLGRAGGEPEGLRSALGVEPGRHGEAFDEGGFAG